MSILGGVRARLRSAFRPGDAESRMEEEFRFHLDMECRRLEREGHAPEQARRIAAASFGGTDHHRESMRDQRGSRWLTDGWLDVKYALRTMRRTPALAFAIAVTFGIGVGVNGIVFSFVNTLLFRPLPVEDPGSLVAMYVRDTQTGDSDPISYEDYRSYRADGGVFTDLAAHNGLPINMVSTGPGPSGMVWGEIASENFFTVLRMRPALGRFFTEADGGSGAPLVVLSHDMWRTRFQSDSGVIGRQVRLNGSPFTIVGVAAKGFHGMRTFGFWTDMWVPLGMHEVLAPRVSLTGRGAGWLLLTGRMKPDATLEATQRSASAFARRLQVEYPATNASLDALVISARSGFDNPSNVPPRVVALASATGLVAASMILILICANLANVQLARAASRAREIAIRLSLGCSRRRLVRQLLVESLVLALPGALIGGALVWLAPSVERTLLPRLQFPLGFDAQPDVRVVLFTAAIALGAMFLIGLLPALRATRQDLAGSLSNVIGAGSRSGRGPLRLRGALVVGQLAVSVVLLVSGTLFVRSLLHAQAADIGFDPSNRLLASVNVELMGYDQSRGRRFYDDALARVRELPGVRSAAWAGPVPFDGFGTGVVFYVDGMRITSQDPGLRVQSTYLSEGGVTSLGLRLQAGREFRPADSAGTEAVMVVSRALADRLWPGRDPIGQRARLGGSEGAEISVAGVVADARYNIIGPATLPHVYLPLRQRYRGASTLVVHTADPLAAESGIRSIISGLDPSLPLYGVTTMANNVHSGFAIPASAAWIFGTLSVIALLVASIGLYAVVSNSVAERTREIGVRIALGSSPSQMLMTIMRRSAGLAIGGLAIGLVLAAAVTRAMSGLLVGLSPLDPATFIFVPVLLVVVSMIAAYLPAHRAVRLDPVQTLRSD